MRPPLAAILLAALLAGCAAPGTPSSSSNGSPGGPVTPLAVRTSIVDPDAGAGEPVVAAAPDGTLYVSGVDGPDPTTAITGYPMTARFVLYRSTDDGATWEARGSPFVPMNAVDPHVATDADGAVWSLVDTFPCNSAGSSRDGGATWTVSHLACGVPISDRPYLVPVGGGTAYVFYHNWHHQGARTRDFGATWEPILVEAAARAERPTGSGNWGGDAIHVPERNALVLSYRGEDLATRRAGPYVLVSDDDAATWTEHVVAEAAGAMDGMGLVTLASDARGRLYAAWTETFAEGPALMLAVSEDVGATWSAPRRIDAGTNATAYPAVSAHGDGAILVAYYEADAPGIPETMPEATTWRLTLALTDLTRDDWTYVVPDAPPAKRGALCTGGPSSCTSDREMGEFLTAISTADGRGVVSWTSTEAGADHPLTLVSVTAPYGSG